MTVKGLTTPNHIGCEVHVCLCRYLVTCCSLYPTGLMPWFSKLREILTLLCCITLSSSREKPTQPQEVAIIALDIIITMRFSINCSAVICSPTVIYAILREATSETYGPRVYFPSYKCPIYFTLQSLLSIYIIKIPKIFILLSLSDLTFASGREGIDNPFIALVARFLFVCVGTR